MGGGCRSALRLVARLRACRGHTWRRAPRPRKREREREGARRDEVIRTTGKAFGRWRISQLHSVGTSCSPSLPSLLHLSFRLLPQGVGSEAALFRAVRSGAFPKESMWMDEEQTRPILMHFATQSGETEAGIRIRTGERIHPLYNDLIL